MRGSGSIMVARGDLAVGSETPRCPRCEEDDSPRARAQQVTITATQMME
jgi:pyruvate kinase